MSWSPDGRVLFFPFNDTKNGSSHRTQVCAGALDPKTLRRTTLACDRGSASFALSPNALAFAMGAGDHVIVHAVSFGAADALPTSREMYRVRGHALSPLVDDAGAVIWTDNDGPSFHERVHLAHGAVSEQIDDAQAVGFLSDGSILLLPDDRPSDAAPLLRTLGEQGRCNVFHQRSRASAQ